MIFFFSIITNFLFCSGEIHQYLSNIGLYPCAAV